MTITIADGRGALWQWDTGRRVKIADGNGVKQVHYQNKCFGRSVDVDVVDDGTAIIPDELLQDWHPLTAYAYVTDDAGGYTKVQVDFAVHKRAKPSGYVYTPTEHAGFDRLRAEIGDLSALKTDAKDNLVAAINEAAASGGADWAQNDPAAKDYVKNRTHYVEHNVVEEIVSAIEFTVQMNDNTVLPVNLRVNNFDIIENSLSVGDKIDFTVRFDGKEYNCGFATVFGNAIPAIGNLHLVQISEADTGEPFFIDFEHGEILCESAGTHTIYVTSLLPNVYHKILPEYLPVSFKTFEAPDGNLEDIKGVVTCPSTSVGGEIYDLKNYVRWVPLFFANGEFQVPLSEEYSRIVRLNITKANVSYQQGSWSTYQLDTLSDEDRSYMIGTVTNARYHVTCVLTSRKSENDEKTALLYGVQIHNGAYSPQYIFGMGTNYNADRSVACLFDLQHTPNTVKLKLL